MSDEELQSGYNKIEDYFPEWPPSHWSFYKLCKGRRTKEAKLNKEFTKVRSEKSTRLIDNLKAGLK